MKFDIKIDTIKSILIKNYPFYIIAFSIAFALKAYYSEANVDDLDWILAPTVLWVKILSGIVFEKVPHSGFINHDVKMIIVPACAGINFMIILFSMLTFSFVHYLKTKTGKFLYIVLSICSAYLITLCVNGLRIIFSIYLFGADIYGGFITPDRVHLIEGTLVYFISLVILYNIVKKLLYHFTKKNSNAYGCKNILYCMAPLFWYLLITIGIPILNKAYKNDFSKFVEHSILVISICSGFILLLVAKKILLLFVKQVVK